MDAVSPHPLSRYLIPPLNGIGELNLSVIFINNLYYSSSRIFTPPYLRLKVGASHLVVIRFNTDRSTINISISWDQCLLHIVSMYYPWHSAHYSLSDKSQYLLSLTTLSVGQRAAFALRQLAICPPRIVGILRYPKEACAFCLVVFVVLQKALNCFLRKYILVINFFLEDIL